MPLSAFQLDDTLFQEAEADPSLSREEAKLMEGQLRTALLKAQFARLKKAQRSLLIVIAGIDGAGKGASICLLNEWMDARHIRTLAFDEPTDQERQYPFLWRYWRNLPANGKIGIVFGSWYRPLLEEAAKKAPDPQKIAALTRSIRDFEGTLSQNNVQIIKLWYHLSEDAQKKRTDQLLANSETAWRVAPEDVKVRKKFGRLRNAGLLALGATHEDYAPWHVIPAADDEMRSIRTGRVVLAALRRRAIVPAKPSDPPMAVEPESAAGRLEGLDYTIKLGDDEYDERIAALQARLAELVRHKRFRKISLVLVFEGQDASGKGGAIRRITHAFDARQFRAIPISAPTDEERAHPYLWRFWRDIPELGKIAIFDRSWYGRVLVERVENLATAAQWQRAYQEITQFESMLRDKGALVLKFWLAVTPDEQLKRFHEREASPFKSFKIGPEDWRNRKKWDAYAQAANEMFERTGSASCPWHVLPANDKRHARVAVLELVVQSLQTALNGKGKT